MFGVEIDQEVYEILGASFEGKNINESGNNLSLGEQQKLGLLRVLSSKAAVVVLDEPFTNLDKDTIYSLTAYIAKIKGKKSIIVITHSPELDPFADMILRIDSGSLVRIDQQVIC
ncbi:MAG: AAA family ATPase [Anaerolineaceae bacterium]